MTREKTIFPFNSIHSKKEKKQFSDKNMFSISCGTQIENNWKMFTQTKKKNGNFYLDERIAVSQFLSIRQT